MLMYKYANIMNWILAIALAALIIYLSAKILANEKRELKDMLYFFEFLILAFIVLKFNSYKYYIFTPIIFILLLVFTIQNLKKAKSFNKIKLILGELGVLVICGILCYSSYLLQRHVFEDTLKENMNEACIEGRYKSYLDQDPVTIQHQLLYDLICDVHNSKYPYYYFYYEMHDDEGNVLTCTDDKNNIVYVDAYEQDTYTLKNFTLNDYFTQEQIDDLINSMGHLITSTDTKALGYIENNEYVITEIDFMDWVNDTTLYSIGEASDSDIELNYYKSTDGPDYIFTSSFDMFLLNTNDAAIQRGKELFSLLQEDDYDWKKVEKLEERYGIYNMSYGSNYTLFMYVDSSMMTITDPSFINSVCINLTLVHTIATFGLYIILKKEQYKD